MNIITLGVSRTENEEFTELTDSNDDQDWNTCLAATCCLEHVA